MKNVDHLEINDYDGKAKGEIESYCTHIIINNTVNRVSEPVLLKPRVSLAVITAPQENNSKSSFS